MKPPDRVQLSDLGLAANPELKGQTGVVEEAFDGGVCVRFGEGREAVWRYLKAEYVLSLDPAPPLASKATHG